MSRKNYILFLLAVLIFNACQKEPEFNYQMVTPNTGDIESIRFSPGHHVLVANGENELNMVVDVYRKYKHTYLDGTVTDTLVLVDPTTFLPGDFKIIHEETGQEVKDLTFSTTDYSNGVATFHAEVGDIVSESKSVELRAPQELPEKRIVDVIFHVFNLSPNDPQYNIFKEAEVTPDLLQAAIDDLNGVFNKAYSKSASSASANIEFRLASKDASG